MRGLCDEVGFIATFAGDAQGNFGPWWLWWCVAHTAGAGGGRRRERCWGTVLGNGAEEASWYRYRLSFVGLMAI